MLKMLMIRVFGVGLTCSLGLSSVALAGGDVAAGEEKSQVCTACHGADGNSENPIYPKLAGQYQDYLEHALRDYQSGRRQNGIMAGFVGTLTKQDIEDLAAFYAAQDGNLFTPTDF